VGGGFLAACRGARSPARSTQRYGTGGYYFGGGIDESGGFSCGPTTVTWSFSSLPTAHAPAQSLGTLTLTDAERAAPVNTSPIFHIGACALIGELRRTVAETMTYLQAIGCRAGRVVPRPKAEAYGYPAHGEVYGLEVHGGVATLVPSGTTVDMVVNP